jgi:DNA-binding transcriptional LysR family regulator
MRLEARLRAFAAVARNRSFSQAAAELFVSQPAISKHLAALESELGTQLVTRGRGDTELTEPGRMLADYVLRAEALLSTARRSLDSDHDTGTLSIAASGIPGTYLLPTLLAGFARERPSVVFDVRMTTSGPALELLRAHEVELALVGGFSPTSELESEGLVEDEVLLVGPPRLAGRRVPPRELGTLTWISREEGSATRASLDVALWQLGIAPPRRLELDSWEAVKLAVIAGLGVAAISRFAVERELTSGELVVLDVPRWRVQRTISVAYARDLPLSPPAARFLESLRAGFPGA